MRQFFPAILTVTLLCNAAAIAHTHLVGSVPADHAQLAAAPKEATLSFAKPVTLTAATLVAPDGAKSALKPLPSGPVSIAHVPLPALAAGHYRLQWRATSADGHAMSGAIDFVVKSPAASTACNLQIDAPWIREAPPGSTSLAAYGTLRNVGKSDLKIADVSTPAAGMTMLHETTVTDGVARMEPNGAVQIPAGGQVKLAPGGKHLMLMELKVRPKAGDAVTITFKDVSGCSTSIDFKVRSISAGN